LTHGLCDKAKKLVSGSRSDCFVQQTRWICGFTELLANALNTRAKSACVAMDLVRRRFKEEFCSTVNVLCEEVCITGRTFTKTKRYQTLHGLFIGFFMHQRLRHSTSHSDERWRRRDHCSRSSSGGGSSSGSSSSGRRGSMATAISIPIAFLSLVDLRAPSEDHCLIVS